MIFDFIEEYDEFSEAIIVMKEVREKMDLVRIQLEYLVNNFKYNCNIYIVDVKEAIFERTEPEGL